MTTNQLDRCRFWCRADFCPKVGHLSNFSAPSAPKSGSLIDLGHPPFGRSPPPPKSSPDLYGDFASPIASWYFLELRRRYNNLFRVGWGFFRFKQGETSINSILAKSSRLPSAIPINFWLLPSMPILELLNAFGADDNFILRSWSHLYSAMQSSSFNRWRR